MQIDFAAITAIVIVLQYDDITLQQPAALLVRTLAGEKYSAVGRRLEGNANDDSQLGIA